LRIPQFLIGVASSGYRSANLPACTGVYPFSLAFQSACDLRRLPISGSAFQLNLRLSSAARFFGQPSNRSSACAFNRSSSPAFQPTFDSRLRPTFRLRLPTNLRPSPHADLPACPPTNLQLAPSANLPAQLSRPRPAFAFCQRSGSAFKPNLRLSSAAAFAWRCPLVYMRPSPLINRPALPATTTSDSHRSLYPSGCLPAYLRLAPPINLPTSPADPTFDSSVAVPLRRCLPAYLRLAPPINLPAQPVDPTSDSSTAVFSGGAFRLTFNLRLGSTFRLAFYLIFDFRLRLLVRRHLRIQRPTYCVSSVEKNIRSLVPVHASANLGISVHFLGFCISICAYLA
jgi:hypothetical protein